MGHVLLLTLEHVSVDAVPANGTFVNEHHLSPQYWRSAQPTSAVPGTCQGNCDEGTCELWFSHETCSCSRATG